MEDSTIFCCGSTKGIITHKGLPSSTEELFHCLQLIKFEPCPCYHSSDVMLSKLHWHHPSDNNFHDLSKVSGQQREEIRLAMPKLKKNPQTDQRIEVTTMKIKNILMICSLY